MQIPPAGFVCGWARPPPDRAAAGTTIKEASAWQARPVRGCLGGCVLFTIAAAVRGVMFGVREAAALAVYRQIAVLFTAAQASLGASEPQSCSSFPSQNHQGEQ